MRRFLAAYAGIFLLQILGPGTASAQAIALSVQPVNGGTSPVAGVPFSVTVQSVDGTSTPVGVVSNTTVTLTLNTGTGPINGTVAGTILATTSSVTISGLTLNTAQTGVSFTATASNGDPLTPANSAAFNVTAGTATHLVITGSSTQTAGTTQSLTITALDGFGNVDPTYTGAKSLTFSGASSSTSPVTAPTVTNNSGTAVAFGTAESITFSAGIATVSGGSNGVMTLYKVESPTITVSDGTISASGANALAVTVSAGSLSKFAWSLTSPQVDGSAFTGTNTLTAQDAWGNTVTGFNASLDNVTVASSLGGSVTGLGSGTNNMLNQPGDFSSGVANLAGKIVYTGTSGSGSFTATSASSHAGTSASITMNNGAASTATSTITANPTSITANGSSNSTITVQLKDVGGNNLSASGGTVALQTNAGTMGSVTNNNNGTYTATLTSAASAGTATITGTLNSVVLAHSATVTFTAGSATRLVITGAGSQTAGTTQSLTITARDGSGNVDPTYAGTKSLTFSGANSSTSPVTTPTVTNNGGTAIVFGSATLVNFSAGVATVSGGSNGVMTLYQAENAIVAVTDGGLSASGSDRLAVTVSAGTLSKFAWALTSPQMNGTAFTGSNTLTAQDAWGNTMTGFNASSDNVTVTTSLGGAVSGLGSGSNNILNLPGDFSSGVANLAGKIVYTGTSGSGSFTATSVSSHAGTSGSIVVNPGAATPANSLITANPTSITANGVSTSTITAQLVDGSGNSLTAGGGTIVLATSLGSIGATTNNNNGQYTATLTSAAGVGTATLSGTLGGLPMTHTATVNFVAGTATKFLVTMSGGTTLLSVASKTAGTGFNVRVTAQDASSNTVSTYTGTVALTSNSFVGTVNATISANGFVDGVSVTPTVAGAGDRTITAVQGTINTANASGNFTVVAAAPASITVNAGTPQSIGVNTAFPLPLSATVRDAFSNPVSGASVTFGAPPAGATGTFAGSVRSEIKATAASGIATSDVFTANGTAGAYTDTALVAGVATPALFSLTNTAGAATHLVIHTPPSTPDTAGNLFRTQPVIWIEDAGGNVVNTNDVVTAARATGFGTGVLQGTVTATAVAGVATFSNLSYNVAETMRLTFTDGALSAATTGDIVVSPGVPARVVLIQPPGTATAGTAIAPAVTAQVQDAFNNVITSAGTQITAALTTGTGVLSGTLTQATVGGTGTATFNNLSINLSGSKNLTFSSPTLTSAVSPAFTINPAAATRVQFVSEPTNANAGVVISPAVTVQLRDQFGNNALPTGNNVVLTVVSGTGTLGGTTSQPPGGTGLATFADLKIAAAGNKTIGASCGALTADTSTVFTITALPPKLLVFLFPPSGVVAGAVITPAVTVQVEDSLGNPLTTNGISVGMTLNGTGALGGTQPQTTSSGIATFANLSINLSGSKTLTASAFGLTSVTSGPFTVSAAAPSRIAFTTSPGNGTAGAAFPQQPVVTLQDPNGNTVTGFAQNVTVAIQNNPAGGTLSGGTTVAVNTSTGQAVFSGLSIDKAGPGYTLTATGNSVSVTPGSILSAAFTISPAAPYDVQVETLPDGTGSLLPAQNVSSGNPITVYSICRDQFGNFISDTVAAWSLINRTGGVAPGDLVAAGNGRSATFTGASLGTAQINAATGSLIAVPSGVLNVANAGPPTKISVETAANGTGGIPPDSVIPSGSRITVFAIARDVAGNFVRNVSAAWSLQSVSGGVVGGDLVPATGSRSATFTGHVIGMAQIRADSTGLAAVVSGKITVVPGSPASVSATAGAGQSVLIGKTFPVKLQATVRDSSGNTVGAGVLVTFAVPSTGSSGTFAGGINTALTNSSGVATAADFTANKVAGTYNDSAKVTGVAAPAIFALTNTSGSPASISAGAGTTPQHTPVNGFFTVPLAAIVRDSSGNPVPGVTVQFTVSASGASAKFSDSQTNTTSAVTAAVTGIATAATLVANNISGTYGATATTAGAAVPAAFVLTNDPGSPSGITVTRGTPQSATVNTLFPDTMTVSISDGVNPVPNVWVTFTAPASGPRGIFARTGKSVDSVLTDARGIANASACKSDTVAGTFQVIATARNTPGTGVFSLTSDPGVVVIFTMQAPGGGVIGPKIATVPFPVLITSRDAFNNPSPNFPSYPVTINVTSNAPLAGGGGTIPFGGGNPPATSLTDTVVFQSAGATDTLKVARVGGAERGVSNAFRVDNPVPVVSSVSPANGNKGQTLTVLINGSGFVSGTSIPYFGGGISPSSWSVQSSTQMSVKISIQNSTPDSTYPVSVINGPPGGGSGTLQQAFTVGNTPAPHITSIAPATGIRLTTLSVVVRGSSFFPGVTGVSLGSGIIVNAMNVDSADQLTASVTILAAAAIGPHNVVVTNTVSSGAGGGVDTLKNAFAVSNPAPVLTGIVPATGNRDQTLDVVFTGDNYVAGTTTVSFGDPAIALVSVNVDSVWRLTARILIGPGAAIGAHTVSVTNGAPGGGTATLTNGFTVANPVPTLSSIAPATGNLGQTLNVLMKGTNFVTGVSTVSFGSGVTINSVRVDSMTQIVTNITIGSGAAMGPRFAVVINPAPGGDSSNGKVFTIANAAPKIRIAVTIAFPSHANASDYSQSDYRIVSLPGGATVPVTKYLPGAAGTDWQMYWDTGADSAYSIPYAADSIFSFSQGRAFWLIKKTSFVVDDSTLAPSLDLSGMGDIPLHAGWNLIGNPFPDSVQWSQVTAVNPALGAAVPYGWAGNWQQSGVLAPYTGYLVQVPDSLPFIAIPVPAGGTAGPASSGDPASWSLRIDLHAAGSVEQVSMLGVSALASSGRNALDVHRPRLMKGVPSTVFSRPEWDSVNSAFGTDIRPVFQKMESWPLEVRTTLRAQVQLGFRGVESVPAQFQAYVIDLDGSRYASLRQAATYAFTPVHDVSRFKVVIGTADAVRAELEAVLPKTFALDNNYPNPFNPSTTLPVAVPRTSVIRLVVYNILGEEIRTLYAGPIEAGRYLFTWDGRSGHGNPVATGIYIVRLSTSAGQSFVRKMALLK